MWAEAGEVEAADVAIIVLAADLPHVAVAVGAHELVKLLPDGVHGAVRGTALPSPSLGFPLAKRARRGPCLANRTSERRKRDTEMGLGWNGILDASRVWRWFEFDTSPSTARARQSDYG